MRSSRHPRLMRRAIAVVIAVGAALAAGLPVAAAVSVASPAAAQAAPAPPPSASLSASSDSGQDPGTAYAYWSFWTGGSTGSWTYSQQPATAIIPADASSVGWRYGVGQTPLLSEPPRIAPDFAAICGSTGSVSDRKRIALVMDPGTPAEAPSGAIPPAPLAICASVPVSYNGLQTVTSVTSMRLGPGGMVCAIGGYPPSGCGAPVTIASITASPDAGLNSAAGLATTSTSPLPFIIGIVIIVILVGITVILSRRRRA